MQTGHCFLSAQNAMALTQIGLKNRGASRYYGGGCPGVL